jgi:hypothetical protein
VGERKAIQKPKNSRKKDAFGTKKVGTSRFGACFYFVDFQ